MSSDLRKEFEWYIANQETMVEQYDGKVIVIKNGEVLGAYETELGCSRKEFEWYIANQETMVEQYDGKVIVIKNGEVLGAPL